MLCEHKGSITVKIDAIAASAASVIAMAGDRVLISPVGMFMIHDPMTIAMGNKKDMEKAIDTLNEVKESIINAYAKKTGLRRNRISELMENETWMNAKKAVELGFADGILFDKKDKPENDAADEEKDEDGKEIEAVWQPYSTRIMGQRVLNRLICSAKDPAGADEEHDKTAGDEAAVELQETGVTVTDKTDTPLKPKEDPGEESEGDESEEDEPDKDTPDKDDLDADDPDKDDSDTDDPDGDKPEEDGDDGDDDDPEEPEKKPKNETAEPDVEDRGYPKIEPDGRTEDGSMPYELLRKQLEFLK